MTEPTEHEPELIDVDEVTTAVIAGVVEMSDMPAFFDRAFSTLPAVLESQGVSPVGPAFALHHRPVTDTADLEVGVPVDRPVTAEGDVRPASLPGGRVARYVHHGAFDDLPVAWKRLESWIADRGLTSGDGVWEVYLTEPSPDMDPADLRTELNWPLR
jgi:effector-binding domain-containing protein